MRLVYRRPQAGSESRHFPLCAPALPRGLFRTMGSAPIFTPLFVLKLAVVGESYGNMLIQGGCFDLGRPHDLRI